MSNPVPESPASPPHRHLGARAKPADRSSAGRWLALLAGPPLAAGLIVAALWRWLPAWAPEWTVRHAPTVEMAARAALIQGKGFGGSYGIGLHQRVRAWGVSACPGLRRCLASPQVGMRQLAAFGLNDLAALHGLDATTRDALATALGDGNDNVRESACEALVAQRDPRPLPILLADLANLRDWRYRRRASALLGRLGDVAAVPALTTALDDGDESVRDAAREALRLLSGTGPVPPAATR